ncbi:MAG: flagellar hook-length control protein FliK [Acidobacteriota bacterium]
MPAVPRLGWDVTVGRETNTPPAPGGGESDPLEADPTLDERPMADAIVRTLRFQAIRDGAEAKLRMHPEYLGDMSVTLRVSGSSVSALVTAESATVRAWLESHQRELRAALGEAGLTLTDLRIDPNGRSRHEDPRGRQEAPRPPVPRTHRGRRFDAFL